jgi:hypothetical protein
MDLSVDSGYCSGPRITIITIFKSVVESESIVILYFSSYSDLSGNEGDGRWEWRAAFILRLSTSWARPRAHNPGTSILTVAKQAIVYSEGGAKRNA